MGDDDDDDDDAATVAAAGGTGTAGGLHGGERPMCRCGKELSYPGGRRGMAWQGMTVAVHRDKARFSCTVACTAWDGAKGGSAGSGGREGGREGKLTVGGLEVIECTC